LLAALDATSDWSYHRAMADPPKQRREFDRHLVRTETMVVEIHPEGSRTVVGTTRDLSRSGVFVESQIEVAIGTEVQLFIGSMRTAAALRVVACVVHVEPGVGFGARFVDEDDESREVVESFISRFRRTG
jgi:hypothetical protein